MIKYDEEKSERYEILFTSPVTFEGVYRYFDELPSSKNIEEMAKTMGFDIVEIITIDEKIERYKI